jgi:hypothetical protein
MELEDEVERLLVKETLVLLSDDFVQRLRAHFNGLLEEERENERGGDNFSNKTEKVDLSNLIDAVATDEYFE